MSEQPKSETPWGDKLQERIDAIANNWWNGLPQPDRTKIIRREFEGAHPTNEDKKRAAKTYDSNNQTLDAMTQQELVWTIYQQGFDAT